jgi:hypothetical protein
MFQDASKCGCFKSQSSGGIHGTTLAFAKGSVQMLAAKYLGKAKLAKAADSKCGWTGAGRPFSNKSNFHIYPYIY